MQLVKRYGLYRSDKISFVNVEDIMPNPNQPRKQFEPEALFELAESISRYGILQPLTVRVQKRKYELVTGERRLRAAKMIGMTKVPCILLDVNIEDSTLLALVENIQRRDLDYVEEAMALSELIRTFDMSQEEAARRIGKSQSAVANKLRLLKLPKDVLDTLRYEKLSERHARALLRLGSNEERRTALSHIIIERLTVAKTEDYIDQVLGGNELLEAEAEVEPGGAKVRSVPVKSHYNKPQFIFKDVRIFLNTVNRATEMIRQSGIKAEYSMNETDSDILVTIKIPKN